MPEKVVKKKKARGFLPPPPKKGEAQIRYHSNKDADNQQNNEINLINFDDSSMKKETPENKL